MCRHMPYLEREDVLARFLAKVRVDPATGCWEWTAGKSRGGDRWSERAWYGTFNPGGPIRGGVRAHVYIACVFGIIPDLRVPFGHNLDHICTNSLCVNPWHLELVSKLENQLRKKIDGFRRLRPWWTWPEHVMEFPFGESANDDDPSDYATPDHYRYRGVEMSGIERENSYGIYDRVHG